MRSESCYPFDLFTGVGLGIPRVAVIIFLLFPLAEVDPAGQFTDYRKVDTATDVFFQRRYVYEGFGGEVAGA